MVFKRRDKRRWHQIIAESVWPRGGWARAAIYVKHRLHRLPDSPNRIARGIFAGVFVCFTPFYGLHFFTAAIIARIIGGNILASLLATFFGNPVTFPFIAFVALKTGYWILGLDVDAAVHEKLREGGAEEMSAGLMAKFSGAFADLWSNFLTIFNNDVAHWFRLRLFYDEVFLPFLVGGIIPGLVAGLIAYRVTLPLISAYQNRRQMKLKQKLEDIRAVARSKSKVTKPGH